MWVLEQIGLPMSLMILTGDNTLNIGGGNVGIGTNWPAHELDDPYR